MKGKKGGGAEPPRPASAPEGKCDAKPPYQWPPIPNETFSFCRIRDAFAALSTDGRFEGIEAFRDMHLKYIADDLAWHYAGKPHVFTKKDFPDHPEQFIELMNIQYLTSEKRVASRAASLRQISKFRKNALELLWSLAEMSDSARAAIEPRNSIIPSDIPRLAILYDVLKQLVVAAIYVSPDSVPDLGVKGAPKKRVVAEIADQTARHFYHFTGKMPTITVQDGQAGGHFISILRVVFEETGVTKASVESQARGAIARLKACMEKSAL